MGDGGEDGSSVPARGGRSAAGAGGEVREFPAGERLSVADPDGEGEGDGGLGGDVEAGGQGGAFVPCELTAGQYHLHKL